MVGGDTGQALYYLRVDGLTLPTLSGFVVFVCVCVWGGG